MQGPRILAGFVQGTLAAVRARDAEMGERVAARLAPETHARLIQASRIAWLELAVDVELTHAIYAELGPTRARELFRSNLTGALDAPVLRSLAQGALRLFGASPARVFGWAPKAYSQLYRDAGLMRFVLDTPGSARLELEALPACVAESARYLDGIAASIAGGFDFMGAKGEVCIESHTPAARRASFRLEWDEDGDRGETLPVLAGA
jgi:hypothetical protein